MMKKSRKGAAVIKGHGSRAVETLDGDAELVQSILKGQAQPNFKSWSDKFNPHWEELASGYLIDLPRQSLAVEETKKDLLGHCHKKGLPSGSSTNHSTWELSGRDQDQAPNISNGAAMEEIRNDLLVHYDKKVPLSGPLIHQIRWAESSINQDHSPNMSTLDDLRNVSSLVAPTSALSDSSEDKSASSQPDVTKLVSSWFPGSFHEISECNRKQVMEHPGQDHASPNQEKDCINSSHKIPPGNGFMVNNIFYGRPHPHSPLQAMWIRYSRSVIARFKSSLSKQVQTGSWSPVRKSLASGLRPRG